MRWSSFVNSTQPIVLPIPSILPDFECFLSNSHGSEVVAFPTAPHLQFQKLLQAYQADFGFKKKYMSWWKHLNQQLLKQIFFTDFIFLACEETWWKILHISLSLSLSIYIYIYRQINWSKKLYLEIFILQLAISTTHNRNSHVWIQTQNMQTDKPEGDGRHWYHFRVPLQDKCGAYNGGNPWILSGFVNFSLTCLPCFLFDDRNQPTF